MVKLPRFFILSFFIFGCFGNFGKYNNIIRSSIKKNGGIILVKLKTCTYCRKIHGKEINCTAKKGYYRDKNTRYEKDKDYIKFIKSKQWYNKSQEIKRLDSYRCLVCQSLRLNSPVYLEVHHIIKYRNDTSLGLDNSNLITLCVNHHKQADANTIKASELYRLIELYRDTTESNDILLL